MTNKIRLHKYVSEYLRKNNLDYTNSDIQKNIQKHGVMINQDYMFNRLEWIFMGEKIDVSHWPKRDHGPFEEIKVIFYNSNLLLVFKPKGVVTEAGAGHAEQNLVSYLQLTLGKKNEQFMPVHRLDKDTQGLIIIAKNEQAHKVLQDKFRERSVIKKYLTILDGKLDQSIRVVAWQSRNLGSPLKQVLFWSEEEAKSYSPLTREAESIFRPIAICTESNQTLVEVEIKTGRMHQIRLQAEAIGLPIKNEKVYNTKVSLKKLQTVEKILQEKEVIEISESEMEEKAEYIFNNSGSFLLCNYLKIQDLDDGILSYQLKNI